MMLTVEQKQLIQLLNMQGDLNVALIQKHGLTDNLLSKTKLSLFTELGELMNEIQTEFKWWKKHAKYDREKALEEYVDCLHFALSLFHLYHESLIDDKHNTLSYEDNAFSDEYYPFDYISMVIYELDEDDLPKMLYWLFGLGKYLGFTWDEIYNTYKKKNAINYQRLKEGY